MEIEFVTFVVKGSMKLTVPTNWQGQIQVGSRSVALRRVVVKVSALTVAPRLPPTGTLNMVFVVCLDKSKHLKLIERFILWYEFDSCLKFGHMKLVIKERYLRLKITETTDYVGFTIN